MSASAESIRLRPTRRRRTAAIDLPVGRRILTWLGGAARATTETRRPIDRPFPFFGE